MVSSCLSILRRSYCAAGHKVLMEVDNSILLVSEDTQGILDKQLRCYPIHLLIIITILISAERMIEYQQALRMPALQCFILDLGRRDETCADILSDAKHFILCFRK